MGGGGAVGDDSLLVNEVELGVVAGGALAGVDEGVPEGVIGDGV